MIFIYFPSIIKNWLKKLIFQILIIKKFYPIFLPLNKLNAELNHLYFNWANQFLFFYGFVNILLSKD
ncbi:MAG: hypothetical protein CVU03_10975 [Bacteroidetes bacterium HGW-Bacteroidetes-2]|nr:MAG: hypothetical protein CVU03_10975 [Bacteroidetes bacterium HGW-Bacteroidetes-2]